MRQRRAAATEQQSGSCRKNRPFAAAFGVSLTYAFLVRLMPFLNRSESITLDQLERVLCGTGYGTYAKPRLKDVIQPSPDEQLALSERRMLDRGHLDFLVLNRATNMPEFAIE
jgi:hypothetical protein